MTEQGQNEEEKPFTYVTSKRKGRGKNNKSKVKTSSTAAQRLLAEQDGELDSSPPSEAALEKMRRNVETQRAMLNEGRLGESIRACFERFLQVLGTAKPTQIYALGMGSVSSNRTAQIQLAFLLELRDDLTSVPDTKLSIKSYDPISSAHDHALLKTYNIHSLDTAPPLGPFQTPTLLYMPHCPRPLYDEYLTASFTRDTLPNVVLCANRLSRYEEFLPPSRVARELPAVWRVVPYLKVVEIPCDSSGALSDLAFQVWGAERAETVVVEEKQSTRQRKKDQHTRTEPIARPTPDDDDYWTLPPRQPSDADAEVL